MRPAAAAVLDSPHLRIAPLRRRKGSGGDEFIAVDQPLGFAACRSTSRNVNLRWGSASIFDGISGMGRNTLGTTLRSFSGGGPPMTIFMSGSLYVKLVDPGLL